MGRGHEERKKKKTATTFNRPIKLGSGPKGKNRYYLPTNKQQREGGGGGEKDG